MKGIVHHCFINPWGMLTGQELSCHKKWQRGKYMAKNQVTNRHAAITTLHVLLDSGAYTTISHQQIYEKH